MEDSFTEVGMRLSESVINGVLYRIWGGGEGGYIVCGGRNYDTSSQALRDTTVWIVDVGTSRTPGPGSTRDTVSYSYIEHLSKGMGACSVSRAESKEWTWTQDPGER